MCRRRAGCSIPARIRIMKKIKLEIDQNNIAILNFDADNERVNILNTETMIELDNILSIIQTNKQISALVIKSKKENIFIAGADINEIKDLKTKKEAQEKIEHGHRIMNKIEDLEIPTIAAVKGACLGGGLELALACDEIITSNATKTILGHQKR